MNFVTIVSRGLDYYNTENKTNITVSYYHAINLLEKQIQPEQVVRMRPSLMCALEVIPMNWAAEEDNHIRIMEK